jgi:hypothetical protein
MSTLRKQSARKPRCRDGDMAIGTGIEAPGSAIGHNPRF